jgi:hypothetical protein
MPPHERSQYWRESGFAYERSPCPRSEIYLETMALFARRVVRLPDHPRMLRELRLLERTTGNGGKDAVNHGRNGHDDFSNVACGVLRLLDARQAAESEVLHVTPFVASKTSGIICEGGVYHPTNAPEPPAPSQSAQPPRPLTDLEKMAAANSKPIPRHYLADYQRANEP